jgi:hypothetical protein
VSQFSDLVKKAFSFLGPLGFTLVSEEDHDLRYENPDKGTFVRLFQTSDDKYVGYRVGLLARPRDALTTAEVTRIAGSPPLKHQFPEADRKLLGTVNELAEHLSLHGSQALDGEPSIYAKAKELRRSYTQRFTR